IRGSNCLLSPMAVLTMRLLRRLPLSACPSRYAGTSPGRARLPASGRKCANRIPLRQTRYHRGHISHGHFLWRSRMLRKFFVLLPLMLTGNALAGEYLRDQAEVEALLKGATLDGTYLR